MDRQSTDEVAAVAARRLSGGITKEDVYRVQQAIGEAVKRGSDLSDAIRTGLSDLGDEIRMLAGSVVSQADGPE